MRCVTILALLALLPAAAHAADCAPPALENQVQMTAIAMRDGSQIDAVPVSINGHDTQFLLDTGGIVSQISAALAGQLKIPINRTGVALIDITGRQAAGLAMIHEFRIGTQARADVPLPISPDPLVPTGLFSLDNLAPYDADMDFPGNLLTLFSQDHCAGVTALPTSATAIPFSLVNGHIVLTVTLDGKDISAILDTGSTETNLRADAAHSEFALVLGAPDTPENGRLEGVADLPTYDHVFKSLGFGGIQFENPSVTIIPIGNRADLLGGPELILGMNMLRTLHLYLAFGERKIYIAPAPP
jgi:predicted aspartyl protease